MLLLHLIKLNDTLLEKIGPDFERRSLVMHIIFGSDLANGVTNKFDFNVKMSELK